MIETVLAERQKTHGDFAEHARVYAALKEVYADVKINKVLHIALDYIMGKIARIITGNAEFADHWVDIQGYAKLAADYIEPKGK